MEAVRSALVPANFLYTRQKAADIAETVKRFHINLIVRAMQRSLFVKGFRCLPSATGT
jgi:hypothetical protein